MAMLRTIFENKDGSYDINELKHHVRDFTLTPDAPNAAQTLAAAVGAQSFAPMTVTQEGPFIGGAFAMHSTRFEATGDHDCTVMITDAGSRKRLTNRPVHANTITGTALLPCVMAEPLFLHETRSLSIRLQSLNAVANTCRFSVQGKRLYGQGAASPEMDALIRDNAVRAQVTTPYYWTTDADITNLAVNTPTSYFFLSEADGYIEIFKRTAAVYDRTLHTLTGTFDYILRDAETRREMESGNMSNQLNLGTGMFPNILYESWVIRPRQRVEIVITNTTATGNPIDAYITLHGRKIYA